MNEADLTGVLGTALSAALEKKGYTTLTAVQLAVLAEGVEGRDLRITSQTGSGKTVAIGFTLREFVALERAPMPRGGAAQPAALVITPTRELARQVEEELSWLYAGVGARVASVTGGASYRDEHRMLASNPSIVVGTPGRLLDHVTRGSIDVTTLHAVVLDEADRMLDMGFRDELEAILEKTPPTRRTHLVSATFPREVKYLADRVQKNPLHLEGTRLGEANADIDHVVHLVDERQRLDAIINLLLASPDERVLLFAKTRADVSDVAAALDAEGFGVVALSGEMEQRERNRALAAFKRGTRRVLVATDVAARGIDVQGISCVIHLEPPTDPDAYTHRSGRTGRAGKKGRSALLTTPRQLMTARRVLARVGVPHRFEPLPTAEHLRAMRDELLVAKLTRLEEPADEVVSDDEVDAGALEAQRARVHEIAKRLAASGDVEQVLVNLLTTTGLAEGPEPRELRVLQPPTAPPARGRFAERPMPTRGGYAERSPRGRRDFDAPPAYEPSPRAARGRAQAEAPAQESFPTHAPRRDEGHAPRTIPPTQGGAPARWVPVHVTWGELHGADPRRMLAMLCRRGGIVSSDIGSIDVGRTSTLVQVSESVADRFLDAAARPDPRDPKIAIRPAEARRKSTGSAPEGTDEPAPAAPPARTARDTSAEAFEKPRPARDTGGEGFERPRPARAARDTGGFAPPRAGAGTAGRPKRAFDDAPRPSADVTGRPKRSFDDAPRVSSAAAAASKPKPKRVYEPEAPRPKPAKKDGAAAKPARPAGPKKRFGR
jgi:ATP-dependent RNA helicase DeaD